MAITTITLKDPQGEDQISVILEGPFAATPSAKLKECLNQVLAMLSVEREEGDKISIIREEDE